MPYLKATVEQTLLKVCSERTPEAIMVTLLQLIGSSGTSRIDHQNDSMMSHGSHVVTLAVCRNLRDTRIMTLHNDVHKRHRQIWVVSRSIFDTSLHRKI